MTDYRLKRKGYVLPIKFFKVLDIGDLDSGGIVFFYNTSDKLVADIPKNEVDFDLLYEYLAAVKFLNDINYGYDYTLFSDLIEYVELAEQWGYKRQFIK